MVPAGLDQAPAEDGERNARTSVDTRGRSARACSAAPLTTSGAAPALPRASSPRSTARRRLARLSAFASASSEPSAWARAMQSRSALCSPRRHSRRRTTVPRRSWPSCSRAAPRPRRCLRRRGVHAAPAEAGLGPGRPELRARCRARRRCSCPERVGTARACRRRLRTDFRGPSPLRRSGHRRRCRCSPPPRTGRGQPAQPLLRRTVEAGPWKNCTPRTRHRAATTERCRCCPVKDVTRFGRGRRPLSTGCAVATRSPS
jgi:hypothetical protein